MFRLNGKLKDVNLTLHKNKNIGWEKKRRCYPDYLLITHLQLRRGLKSAGVFQAASKLFLLKA